MLFDSALASKYSLRFFCKQTPPGLPGSLIAKKRTLNSQGSRFFFMYIDMNVKVWSLTDSAAAHTRVQGAESYLYFRNPLMICSSASASVSPKVMSLMI